MYLKVKLNVFVFTWRTIYYLYAYMYICMIKEEIMNLGGNPGNMGKHL